MTSMQVFGIREAQMFLKGKNKSMLRNINKEIHKQGFFLEGEVKQSIAGRRAEPASVDTGRFLNSVSTDNTKFMQSTVKSELEYAKYLEFGTSRLSPRRHFKNSGDRNKGRIGASIRAKID